MQKNKNSSQKYQKLWEDLKIYQAKENKKKKKYILVEFPYPSGSGLHVGHSFSFTGADVYARFKRMKGENVLFPMGWDAFGLPTENYAIKAKKKPQEITKENTAYFKEQMNDLGFSFDWTREINTTDPGYYKWTQWIFIQLFKKGLAYKQEQPINWCPKCKTGLANEEVINGMCERCGTEVSKKNLSQWIVRITDYADRLINGLGKTDFIEKVKNAQINWIGKSEGAKVVFKLKNKNKKLEIFTTRPDTLWGATFMVISPEHDLVKYILENAKQDKRKEINDYLIKTKKKSDMERTELAKEKTGIFTECYAINPVNNKDIPIWISDFVLASYGTGAIMAVPAHDERDWEFAKKFGLKIIPVIQPNQEWDFNKSAYIEVEKGTIINSEPINGLTPEKAFQKMIKWLEKNKLGEKAQNYHLRDWIFSRQHYWGEPIPMIYCEKCGWQPVNERDLPIELPEVEHYEPTETGESPLSKMEKWMQTVCPKCGGQAKRETDTMPNWAGSDWYFLRYIDPNNKKTLANQEKMKNWLPVDIYIGGDEHNTLHLLYSRFIYQFLWDIGAVPKECLEPYQKRISHGVILGPDNQRMSKSRGNVVIPEKVIERFDRYGADILRMYLMFIGPFSGTMVWNDNALMGIKKFLDKVEGSISKWLKFKQEKKLTDKTQILMHQTIKKVTEDIEKMRFNTAIAHLMSFSNELKGNEIDFDKKSMEDFIILLSIFTPFFSEEQWHRLNLHKKKQSIFQNKWPEFDIALVQKKEIELVVQINGKIRGKVNVPVDITEQRAMEIALEQENIKRYLKDKKIKKTIFVPKKLINIVI